MTIKLWVHWYHANGRPLFHAHPIWKYLEYEWIWWLASANGHIFGRSHRFKRWSKASAASERKARCAAEEVLIYMGVQLMGIKWLYMAITMKFKPLKNVTKTLFSNIGQMKIQPGSPTTGSIKEVHSHRFCWFFSARWLLLSNCLA